MQIICRNALFYKMSSLGDGSLVFIKPFHTYTWICIFLVLVICCCSFYLAQNLTDQNVNKLRNVNKNVNTFVSDKLLPELHGHCSWYFEPGISTWTGYAVIKDCLHFPFYHECSNHFFLLCFIDIDVGSKNYQRTVSWPAISVESLRPQSGHCQGDFRGGFLQGT